MRRTLSQMPIMGVVMIVAAAFMAPAAAQQQKSASQQQPTSQSKPIAVDLADLEAHPEKYLGQTVTVEGEVSKVLGPQLFAIDKPFWIDFHGDMLVVVPEPLAAIVRRDAPVMVTGKVQKIVEADVQRRWGILSKDPKIRMDLTTKPALVASEVTTLAPALVSLIVRPDQTVGTSGSASTAPLTDLNRVATATDTNLVGRRVDLQGTVTGTADEGFWIRTPAGERLFVLPTKKTAVREGQTAEVKGVVLEMPRQMRAKIGDTQSKPIYVYADSVATR